jgi:hypothetical protein
MHHVFLRLHTHAHTRARLLVRNRAHTCLCTHVPMPVLCAAKLESRENPCPSRPRWLYILLHLPSTVIHSPSNLTPPRLFPCCSLHQKTPPPPLHLYSPVHHPSIHPSIHPSSILPSIPQSIPQALPALGHPLLCAHCSGQGPSGHRRVLSPPRPSPPCPLPCLTLPHLCHPLGPIPPHPTNLPC